MSGAGARRRWRDEVVEIITALRREWHADRVSGLAAEASGTIDAVRRLFGEVDTGVLAGGVVHPS